MRPGIVRDAAIGLAITVSGAILIKFADIPTRVSIVETKIAETDQQLGSMDKKLDILINRRR